MVLSKEMRRRFLDWDLLFIYYLQGLSSIHRHNQSISVRFTVLSKWNIVLAWFYNWKCSKIEKNIVLLKFNIVFAYSSIFVLYSHKLTKMILRLHFKNEKTFYTGRMAFSLIEGEARDKFKSIKKSDTITFTHEWDQAVHQITN